MNLLQVLMSWIYSQYLVLINWSLGNEMIQRIIVLPIFLSVLFFTIANHLPYSARKITATLLALGYLSLLAWWYFWCNTNWYFPFGEHMDIQLSW